MDDPSLHPLLVRQIKKARQITPDYKLDLNALLSVISQTYEQADLSRRRLQRSMSVTSEELGELYEKAKVAQENAEQANDFKSQFLANMSHEIRTPLNGLLGFMKLLLKTELNNVQSNYLNIAISSGESLNRLLNDLLDLSKIESGNFTLNNVEFDPSAVIQSSLNTFSGQAALKNIAINSTISPKLAKVLIGDAGRLVQILNNLIGNAVKFTSEGSVKVDVHIMQETTTSQTLCVIIKDTGIGIPDDKIDLIFEKYTQAEVSKSLEASGTGLGLPICKHLCKMMGGHISVSSQFGESTEFRIEIPFEIKTVIPSKLSAKDTFQLAG